ncbi:unnamed protein product, partial [Allacma fusca]
IRAGEKIGVVGR